MKTQNPRGELVRGSPREFAWGIPDARTGAAYEQCGILSQSGRQSWPSWKPAPLSRSFSSRQIFIALRNEIPVDDMDNGAEVIGSTVLIFQVVGMLPYIDPQ